MKKIMQIKSHTLKTLSLIMVICLLLSACGKSSGGNLPYNDDYNQSNSNEMQEESSEPLHKTEVPDGYIGIYTVEDLINSGKNSSANYIIMNDLDLSSVSDWDGIKNEGIYDGNNYIIKNLKSTNGGLFTYAKNLSNFNLENVSINVMSNKHSYITSIGGLADSGSTLNNCKISGNIMLTINKNFEPSGFGSYDHPKYNLGGIIGSVNDGIITNCINNTNISVKNEINTYYSYIGGISGSGGEILNCKNYGQINITTKKECQSAIAGGICGQTARCLNDCNYGEIFSSGVSGGIVGYINSSNFEIDSCYNSGIVKGKQQENLDNLGVSKGSCAGGIVGYILYSTNGTITNSYNVGEISGADNCGGIVGGRYNTSGLDIKYCAYSNNEGIGITGDSAMFADNKAMSLDEMKDIENYPFNNKEAWKNGIGDYPYPVIK